MAKPKVLQDVPEVDALTGYPLPNENLSLFGHSDTEQFLLNAYRSERLHHAWILGGPKGIGKSTLAFRFARYVIANPDRFSERVKNATTLSISADHPVARQLGAGGHPNILHLRRPWDERAKRFKTDLPVDEVRKTVSFFGTTASANAWRVCIVDAADDMNVSSANALLKILEEPPARCLFLVLSHTPGRLLPTIRSRCRRIDLSPLNNAELGDCLKALAPSDLLDEQGLAEVVSIADGSVRDAITLLSGDGLSVVRAFIEIAEKPKSIDMMAVHTLADTVSAKGQSDNWESFKHICEKWLHKKMRLTLKQSIGEARRYIQLWERVVQEFSDTEALNLDRKQVVLNFFVTLKTL